MYKNLFILLLCTFSLLLYSCTSKKVQPWTPVLNESAIYVLKNPIADLKKRIESSIEFQKKGQLKKYREAIKQVQVGINELEFYYMLLLNAKAHISAAYQHFQRDETKPVEQELKNAREQLQLLKESASGKTLNQINSLMIDIQNLEKQFKNLKEKCFSNFIKIAEQLDKLLNEGKNN